MKDSVKIFDSIIFNFNYIASVNIEEESTAIANIFKMIFLIIIILTLLSTALLMLYFPLDINSELSLISLYVFFTILISFVIFSFVVDILLGVHHKDIYPYGVRREDLYQLYIVKRYRKIFKILENANRKFEI